MASAINSLPVPVSPWSNTVASVGPTRRTRPSTRWRAALLPTILDSPLPRSSLLSSTMFAGIAFSISDAQIVLVAISLFLSLSETLYHGCFSALSFSSLSLDPLTYVCRAILQCDAVCFAALKEGDGIFIHQG